MTLRKTIRQDNAKWLQTLTEPQLRALACQHEVATWRTDEATVLVTALCALPMITSVRDVMAA